MAVKNYTSFSKIYDSFYAKITDDMYLEFTEAETSAMAQDLLLTAVHKFEFPRTPLYYRLNHHNEKDADGNCYKVGAFKGRLTAEEINIIAIYMVVEWIGQQLASIENTRMKYSGSDFKFTSQANHMQKLLLIKKDYEREGFHMQRLYKRRIRDINGVYHSTFSKIMEPEAPWPTQKVPANDWTDWGSEWSDEDDDEFIGDSLVWHHTVYSNTPLSESECDCPTCAYKDICPYFMHCAKCENYKLQGIYWFPVTEIGTRDYDDDCASNDMIWHKLGEDSDTTGGD